MVIPRAVLVLVAATFAPQAGATVLYKSVGPTGVVEFSDTPPGGSAKIIEQREIGGNGAAATPSGEDAIIQASNMFTVPSDDAISRASAQVDLAEHALALARRGVWSPTDGLRLGTSHRTVSDEERIEYYKRGVLAARQSLLEVLRQRLASR